MTVSSPREVAVNIWSFLKVKIMTLIKLINFLLLIFYPLIFYCLFCICFYVFAIRGFLNGLTGEESACNAGDIREWLPTSVQFSRSVFTTPGTATCQASLAIINSRSLLKLMSIKLMMPSNHLILCCPLFLPPSIFPSIMVFSNESVGQSIGVSALASVFPKNI